MKLPEPLIRSLARRSDAWFELVPFQEALSKSSQSDEFVNVILDVNGENKSFDLERDNLVDCVRWIEEETKAETALLEQIKPSMRTWMIQNRDKMVERIKKALSSKETSRPEGVILIWEIDSPDLVPTELAQAYVKKYGGN